MSASRPRGGWRRRAHASAPPSAGDEAAPRRTALHPRWAVAAVSLVVLVAAVWWFYKAEERLARADVAALSAAVAEHVGERGRLPRVTVTTQGSVGDEVGWGEEFVVESRHVPRADPSRARTLFVVGDADRWCVEVQYFPPGTLTDWSPSAWVARRGAGGEAGRVVGGRCGEEYVLFLSPVTHTDVPRSGSVVDAASAALGTCVAHPFTGESAGGDVMFTGLLEVVSCDAEHFGEVYHSGVTEGGYEQAWLIAAESCGAAFTAFVGVPGNLSAFSSEAFTVSEAQWQTGERRFSCVLFLGSEDYPLVGSARDSWR